MAAGGEVVRVSDSARPGRAGAGAGGLRAESGAGTFAFVRFHFIHLFPAHRLDDLCELPRVPSPPPSRFRRCLKSKLSAVD